ncbi:4a-hydroxytetrahydrobiopterin dehydratase [Pseudonocardia xishanensis]
MADLLSDDAVTTALAELNGWTREGDSIVRTAELSSFPAAIAVVDRVAEDAEERDHHPDIDIRWRTVTFRLSTHSEGGLTSKDTELAARIDARIAAAD